MSIKFFGIPIPLSQILIFNEFFFIGFFIFGIEMLSPTTNLVLIFKYELLLQLNVAMFYLKITD